ncbi:MerR family transcriptional regulator [Rhodococcus sp. IEGM 1366]|uniref:MerR family transcriptional regulator n=1 Tax=Rhodococcus TaxID=1827 RepID=UPI003988BBC0
MEVQPRPPAASTAPGVPSVNRKRPLIPAELPDSALSDKFDDEDYPAYSMGQAADILGVRQAFLRSLDAAKLLAPQRSEGGHRRYSRYQLRIAARAHELVANGTALDSACRIIILEDQLAEARRINAELQQARHTENDAGTAPE